MTQPEPIRCEGCGRPIRTCLSLFTGAVPLGTFGRRCARKTITLLRDGGMTVRVERWRV